MRRNGKRSWILFVAAVCFVTGLLFRTLPAYGDEEEGELIIRVVEEIPAEDIYDEEVPMAAQPTSANQSGTRHLLMMSFLLLLSCGYVGYFSHYEKRIDSLKEKVIQEEEKRMAERNSRFQGEKR